MTAGIRDKLNGTGKCPECGSTHVKNVDLKPDVRLRERVDRFRAALGSDPPPAPNEALLCPPSPAAAGAAAAAAARKGWWPKWVLRPVSVWYFEANNYLTAGWASFLVCLVTNGTPSWLLKHVPFLLDVAFFHYFMSFMGNW